MLNCKALLVLALLLVVGNCSCSFGAAVVQLAAGEFHTVALKSDGTVWAWGSNTYGQLGDLTYIGKTTPVQVVGPGGTGYLNGVVAIAAGFGHSVALKSDGTVWAWGRNGNGQLGDGTANQTTAPVQVLGVGGAGYLAGVTAIAAGAFHTVALKSDGTVWAWGMNSYAQLGDGTTGGRSTPVQVLGAGGVGNVTGITSISAGWYHTVALRNDGTVWDWGYNNSGQLGDSTTTQRSAPVQVQGSGGVGFLSGVAAIAGGGYHTVALKSDGTVWSWGRNMYGQLGDTTTSQRTSPVQATGVSGCATIAAGANHTIAQYSDGSVWAWGLNNYGQLGDASVETRPSRVQVLGAGGVGFLAGITAIAAGESHTAALKNDGTVWAWGFNSSGQLGDMTKTERHTPAQTLGLSGGSGAAAVVAGGMYTVALKSDGTVWDWGWNTYGQLGDGTITNRSTPVEVLDTAGTGYLAGITAVAAGYEHTAALRSDGTVWGWGRNYSGRLGIGTFDDDPHGRPLQVVGVGGVGFLTGITAISTGSSHAVALRNDGTVWAWGYDGQGQLGDGTSGINKATPVQVVGPGGAGFLTGVTAISAGYWHTVALKSDGTVWAWGINTSGRLGDGTTNNRTSPVQVVGPGGVGFLTGVVAIAASFEHTVALKSDGTVWAWGANAFGRLGDGTYTQRTTPVQVVGPGGVGFLTGITAIAAGQYHTVALKNDGTVWGCGLNSSGQLGDGTTYTDRNTPVQTVGPGGTGYLTGVTAISAGVYHTAALRSDGAVLTWGFNSYGQIGDGTTANRSAPIRVAGLYLAGSVVINGGADYTAVSGVTLALWAVADAGTISQMCISNDGVCDTEPWEAYGAGKSWTLSSGDGEKTVSVRFRDPFGNESATASDTIFLDTSSPSLNLVTVSPPMVACGDTLHIVADVTDLAGVQSVTAAGVALAKTGDTTWECDIPASSSLGSHTVSMSSVDVFGHDSRTVAVGYITAKVLGLARGRDSYTILPLASSKWLFKVWGRVTIIDANSFYLSDGSWTPVRVVAPGYSGLANGDCVAVRGIVNAATYPPTLTGRAEHVVRYR